MFEVCSTESPVRVHETYGTPVSTYVRSKRFFAAEGWAVCKEGSLPPPATDAGSTQPIEFEIRRLPSIQLAVPIRAAVSYVDGEWVAETTDFPLYGSGSSLADAKAMLSREVESLWDDLNGGGNFSDDWISVRRLLQRAIGA